MPRGAIVPAAGGGASLRVRLLCAAASSLVVGRSIGRRLGRRHCGDAERAERRRTRATAMRTGGHAAAGARRAGAVGQQAARQRSVR